MSANSQRLALAVRHHRSGEFQEAETLYREILEQEPNAEVLQLLGIVTFQTGRTELAVEHLRHALQMKPDLAEAHTNLSNILWRQGKIEEAIAGYREAIRLKPDLFDAHHYLGAVLAQQGRLEEAIACYREALRLKPGHDKVESDLREALHRASRQGESRPAAEANSSAAEALQWSQQGAALYAQGRLDDAITCFREARRLNPRDDAAWSALGAALAARNQMEEATVCLREAIRINPNNTEALHNLGAICATQGRPDETVKCFREIVRLRPDNAEARTNLATALTSLGSAYLRQGALADAVRCNREALLFNPNDENTHYNLGSALGKQGFRDEARHCYHEALRLRPDFADAHINLGNSYRDQGKLDEAISCYRDAVRTSPTHAKSHYNLGVVLQEMGRVDDAIACYQRALELRPDFPEAYSNLIFILHFSPAFDAPAIFEELRRRGEHFPGNLGAAAPPHANDRTVGRRLRVGYVSPYFHQHAESFFTVPLFEAHDHRQLEIFFYSDAGKEDDLTPRFRACADVWREIRGLSDEQAAQLVRDDRIDVLVDLTMHMHGNRLRMFARKPAPVQVCWLAYPGTTGLSAIDYRLTDAIVDPPGLFDRCYVEESIRLPDCFAVYDPLASGPEVHELPALSNGFITFGSLNNFYKMNAEVIRLWAQAMTAVKDSRLILLAPEASCRAETLERLEEQGVAPERVQFVGRQGRHEYLELHQRIDIGLDTVPYNGHTTSLDSFWMGVPVITMVGKRAAGRVGRCLLENLGLPELIAHDPEQFAAIAVRLSNDMQGLSTLRAALRDRLRNSVLMDGPRFARNVEAAYRSMWQRWCGSGSTG